MQGNESSIRLGKSTFWSCRSNIEPPWGEAGCLQDILRLRLVCSSWRAAVSQYSGLVRTELKTDQKLSAICKILPGLSELDVQTQEAQLDLGPLLTCSHLSVFSLTRLTPEIPSPPAPENGPRWLSFLRRQELVMLLDCAQLPASLTKLCLDNVRVDPNSLQSLSCPQLRQVKYLWDHSHPAEACDLLKRMPKLEVSLYHDFIPQSKFCQADRLCEAWTGYPVLNAISFWQDVHAGHTFWGGDVKLPLEIKGFFG